jgi:hypothetical protein
MQGDAQVCRPQKPRVVSRLQPQRPAVQRKGNGLRKKTCKRTASQQVQVISRR